LLETPRQQIPASPLPDAPRDRLNRRARQSAGPAHLTDPIAKMEWIMGKCDLGAVPLSQQSTQIATTFIYLYEVGLAAMEQHRASAAHAQIVGRVALALAGVTRRRQGSYTARELPAPIDQESVTGVMTTMVAQLQALDVNGTFAKPLLLAQDGQWPSGSPLPSPLSQHQSVHQTLLGEYLPNIVTERVDLSLIADNVERGLYFKGVESPAFALARFQRHVLTVWANAGRAYSTNHPIGELASRLDRVCRTAIGEIRDALGVANLVEPPSPRAVTAAVPLQHQQQPQQPPPQQPPPQQQPGFAFSAPVPDASSSSSASAEARKRPRRRDAEGGSSDEMGGAVTVEMHQVIKQDLARAHARIDALVSLIEKVANPLQRGLEKLGKI
jgi:hypothetical protein